MKALNVKIRPFNRVKKVQIPQKLKSLKKRLKKFAANKIKTKIKVFSPKKLEAIKSAKIPKTTTVSKGKRGGLNKAKKKIIVGITGIV